MVGTVQKYECLWLLAMDWILHFTPGVPAPTKIFTADLRRQLANDRCNSSSFLFFPFWFCFAQRHSRYLASLIQYLWLVLKTFAGTLCGALRSVAQPFSERNLALNTFFANTHAWDCKYPPEHKLCQSTPTLKKKSPLKNQTDLVCEWLVCVDFSTFKFPFKGNSNVSLSSVPSKMIAASVFPLSPQYPTLVFRLCTPLPTLASPLKIPRFDNPVF